MTIKTNDLAILFIGQDLLASLKYKYLINILNFKNSENEFYIEKYN